MPVFPAAPWTPARIRAVIATSPGQCARMLIALHARQTADEQASRDTRHRNGAGFNARDAAFLSSLAEQARAGHPLTSKQLAAARRALPKYAGQLADAANARRTTPRLATRAA